MSLKKFYVLDKAELKKELLDLLQPFFDGLKFALDQHQPNPVENYISIQEAADHLGCSRSTLHKLMKEGKVKPYKIGKSTKFLRSELKLKNDQI